MKKNSIRVLVRIIFLNHSQNKFIAIDGKEEVTSDRYNLQSCNKIYKV